MTPNSLFARTLVAALEAAGVRHACVGPGSRNTPISLALADSGIEDTSHHDERSGAFVALGIAKTSGSPVVVTTTSGTAATELHPAVAEADASDVPLIVVTADRPAYLFDVAAPQTIDQVRVFGTATRWAHDVEVAGWDDPTRIAALGTRLVSEAIGGPAGPVHVNARFDEPLVIDDDPAPDVAVPEATLRRIYADPADVSSAAQVLAGRRGVIVAGPMTDRAGSAAIASLGTALGWPVLTDPISGLRTGIAAQDSLVGSDLLAGAGLLDDVDVEVVLRFGRPPTSKALSTWLAEHRDVPQVLVAPHRWPDAPASSRIVLRSDPGPAAESIAQGNIEPTGPEWLDRWKSADAAASAAADEVIATAGFPTEPGVVRALAGTLADGAALWAGSSMPIRDVDTGFPVTSRPVSIHANRGANGIDGFVSSALGAASLGAPTVALTGDVGMLHDIGSLATMSRLSIPLTVVVVNNDGGGIFHFLPQAGHRHFERHFGTPHGLSFVPIAEAFGVEAHAIEDEATLFEAIAKAGTAPRLLEVKTDREQNIDVHRAMRKAASQAVRQS